MKKPPKISIISILYILGGILLICLTIGILYLHFSNSTLIIDLLWTVFPSGGFNAGDTFITINQIYITLLFLIPISLITGIISIIGGYLAITSTKKIAWYLMILSSILYCLIIIGLIIDYIFLQKDVKEIYSL
ncbi:MAG: hypothetical protein ACTSPY_06495 [Candidatus Helarchaeota archaeon]